MAETESQHTLMLNSSDGLNDNIHELTETTKVNVDICQSAVSAADILQQALQEATAEFGEVAVSYESVENAVAVVHGELQTDDNRIFCESVEAGIDVNSGVNDQNNEAIALVDDIDNSKTNTTEIQNNVLSSSAVINHSDQNSSQVITFNYECNPEEASPVPAALSVADSTNCDSASSIVDSAGDFQSAECSNSSVLQTDNIVRSVTYPLEGKTSALTTSTGVSISQLSLPPKSKSAPLGSSENPIQIIQQGNTYHSTQLLSEEQLHQIAHVLQQQQVSKSVNNGGRAVLYDQATNTRIIYRVIYPSELYNKDSSKGSNSKVIGRGSGQGRSRGRPRKGWGRRAGDDEGRFSGPDLSKEEKEEKKRHRPRTRSGRISRPPSYMVKDYKRIHHLDFDEEPYDDSDGGYSDYQVSDEEARRRNNSSSLPPGVTTSKQRNYKCGTCEKAYIGKGGLARHFRLHSNHGSMADMNDDYSTHDENSNSSMSSSVLGSTYSHNPINSSLSDTGVIYHENTNNNVNSESLFKNKQKQNNNQHDNSARRRNKLREFIRCCHDEELIDVVFPRLARVLTLWEFLLMKSKRGIPRQLQISDIFEHFEALLLRIQKFAKECLIPTSSPSSTENQSVQINSGHLSQSLSINPGHYDVESSYLKEASLFLGKRLSTNHRETDRSKNVRRTVEIICNDELMSSLPIKRQRIERREVCLSEEALSTDLQMLNDSVQDVDSLVLSNLQSEGLDDSNLGEAQRHDESHLLVGANVQDDLDTSRVLFELPNCSSSSDDSSISVNKGQTLTFSSSPSVQSTNEIQSCSIFRTHSDTSQQFQNIQVRKVQIFGSSHQPECAKEHSLQDKGVQNAQTNSQLCHDNEKGIEQTANCATETAALTSRTEESDISECITSSSPSLASANVYSAVRSLVASGHIVLDGTSVRGPDNVVLSIPDMKNNENNSLNSLGESSAVTRDSENNHADCLMTPSEDATSVPSAIVDCNQFMVDENRMEDFREVVCSDNTILSQQSEGTAIIRQLVLPDYQVIGTWSGSADQTEEVGDLGEQIAHNLLPGNVVIVQNPDGTTTLQVPNDHTIPLETLQALLAMDHAVATQEETENEQQSDQIQAVPVPPSQNNI